LFKLNTLQTCAAAAAALALLFSGVFIFNFPSGTSSMPVTDAGPPVARADSAPVPEPAGGDAPAPEDLPLTEGNINSLPPDTISELLAFLDSPIAGATIGMTDGQLPGAPRPYRNGTHQGIDYYDGFSGVPIRAGTAVLAAAEGRVVRIDHDYRELTPEQHAAFRRLSAQAPDTPAEALDRFRGRQVWLEHRGRVVTRYAHLESVENELTVGDRVYAGQPIGTAGNSGTSQAAAGSAGEVHLHFEIWLNGFYLGEGLPPDDIRHILRGILE
jgi:murein DD-endopeptidase MepM/ murein hydrolase activator NlpD